MAYTDVLFNEVRTLPVVGDLQAGVALGTESAVGGGTSTYSGVGTASINGAYVFPKFFRPVKLLNVKVFIQTKVAPTTDGISNQQFFILNGTQTAATVTIGTNTTGVFVDAVMATDTIGSNGAVTSPCIITTSGGQFTMKVTNTNTATASTLGKYAMWFEYVTQFVS